MAFYFSVCFKYSAAVLKQVNKFPHSSMEWNLTTFPYKRDGFGEWFLTNIIWQKWHMASESRSWKSIQLLPGSLSWVFGTQSHYVRSPSCCALKKSEVTYT